MREKKKKYEEWRIRDCLFYQSQNRRKEELFWNSTHFSKAFIKHLIQCRMDHHNGKKK